MLNNFEFECKKLTYFTKLQLYTFLFNQTKFIMKRISLLCFLIMSIAVFSVSCKKDVDNNSAAARMVKLEIVGNYPGTILVAYTTAGGAALGIEVKAPWTKEITYESSVTTTALVASANVTTLGAPGQTLTFNIYSAGKVVKTETVTTNASGNFVSLPNMFYMFP